MNNQEKMHLAHVRAEAELYLNIHGLSDVIDYVSKHNYSNDIPYHNLNHLIGVTQWCGRLAAMRDCLHKSETKGLLLAAMFHDFNHSGGKEVDQWNITEAITALDRYCDYTNMNEVVCRTAYNCIKVTEFPFIHKPVSEFEMIIRDADLLYGLGMDYKTTIVDGLRKEVSVKKGHINRPDWVKMNSEFRQNLVFFTDEAEFISKKLSPILEQAYEEY